MTGSDEKPGLTPIDKMPEAKHDPVGQNLAQSENAGLKLDNSFRPFQMSSANRQSMGDA